MITQMIATVKSIHRDRVLLEYPHGNSDRAPLSTFPPGIKVGDQVLVGVETSIKFAVLVNGEDIPSTLLTTNWSGYRLTFTSTSDSGRIELKERGRDQLDVWYIAGKTKLRLGTITAEWDSERIFSILWFTANPEEPQIQFVYLSKQVHEPVELFYDQTTFRVISEQDRVKSVVIQAR